MNCTEQEILSSQESEWQIGTFVDIKPFKFWKQISHKEYVGTTENLSTKKREKGGLSRLDCYSC